MILATTKVDKSIGGCLELLTSIFYIVHYNECHVENLILGVFFVYVLYHSVNEWSILLKKYNARFTESQLRCSLSPEIWFMLL